MSQTQPLCVDLFCGLGGWTEGFVAEGYRVIGFDIERHRYHKKCPDCDGTGNFYRNDEDGDFLECDCYQNFEHYGTVMNQYPGQLVLQDVTTLHGSQFKDAAVIVASPPCQAYSYRAMPWKRAKALGPPDNTLFETCFRLQREASEAAGRYIPLVVENVKGAQPWVGRAKWHHGSFYLWGDVPALMPITFAQRKSNADSPGKIWDARPRESQWSGTHGVSTKNNGGSWFAAGSPGQANVGQNPDGRKVPGMNWSGHGTPGYKPKGFNVTAAQRYREEQGNKGFAKRFEDTPMARVSSKSDSRKAASAQIAKIPFPLAQHIARVFKPV